MKKEHEALPEASVIQSEASRLAIDDLPDIAVTQSDFARRIGVSRQTVSRAVKAGRLVLTPAGRLDLKSNLRRWNDTKAHTRPDREAGDAAEMGDGSFDGDISDTDARSHWRAEILKCETQSLRLDMDLRRRRRYHLEQAEAAMGAVGGSLRGGIERLIDQLAPGLAAADPAERPALVAKEITRLRAEMKKTFQRAQRQLDTK